MDSVQCVSCHNLVWEGDVHLKCLLHRRCISLSKLTWNPLGCFECKKMGVKSASPDNFFAGAVCNAIIGWREDNNLPTKDGADVSMPHPPKGERDIVQRLIYSIVQFLRSQLERSGSSCLLNEEGAESVEVSLQCLETAYGISQDNSHLAVSRSLYEIFSESIKDEVGSRGSIHNLGSTVPNVEEKEEAEILKNDGNALMREEKYDQALDCYTRAISKDSTNAVYYCNRAAAHSKLNNHQEAVEDCKRALNIEPQYSKAYGRLGLAYSALEDSHKAKECYQKALQLEPDNESYRSNLQIAIEKITNDPQTGTANSASFNPFAALGGSGNFNLGSLGSIAAGLGSGGTGGPPDVQGLFNNPALMNMATQLMQDPNIQNMMGSFLGSMGGMAAATGSGSGSPAGENVSPGTSASGGGSMEALLSAGRQLAEQMQAQHPDLVEQLRSQMTRGGPSQDDTDGSGSNQDSSDKNPN